MNYQKIIRDNLGDYVNSFYLAMEHTEQIKKDIYEYCEKYLGKKISIHSILITLEKCNHTHKATNGEHYHFVVFHRGDNLVINKKVTNSLMRHFAEKYELTGNSDGTKVRQYGLIKRSIRSVPDILRYVTKEIAWGNYLYPPYKKLDVPLWVITKTEEDTTSLLNILEGLPSWDKGEETTTRTFFRNTLYELNEETLKNSEIKNNEFAIIEIILKQYDLAKKHPPNRSVVQQYLRIYHRQHLSLYDFIHKYYL